MFGAVMYNFGFYPANFDQMSALPVISLFTGAGGLDLGLEAAGFDFGAGVELDSDCIGTLRRSRPSWKVLQEDAGRVSAGLLLRTAGISSGRVALVAAGPPCQPFSKAGYWARGDAKRMRDPRAATLDAFLRIVEDVLPAAILLENVGGLAFDGKDEGLRKILLGLRKINRTKGSHYSPQVKVLNAADYGVPQVRQRVFVVAHRDGLPFCYPAPTHTSASDIAGIEGGLEAYRTAWDAIGDLEPPTEDLSIRGKWAGLLPSIPEGKNYLHHTERGDGFALFGWRRRYWSFLLKLAKTLPSWTIPAHPGPAAGPFHWDNRRLSRRELARLQTFPDDVFVVGSQPSVQRQLGNAVPSLLAEVIGRELIKQYFGGPTASDALTLLPPKRIPVPKPSRVARVPSAFRNLKLELAPHPGTGRGAGAIARRTVMDGRTPTRLPRARTRQATTL